MKKDIHPNYQEVMFIDSATGHRFICGTTLHTKEKETFEGKEYPVCRVPISSASHPFFTGEGKLLDSEGRVDKFNKRYAKKAAPAPSETTETVSVPAALAAKTTKSGPAKKAK